MIKLKVLFDEGSIKYFTSTLHDYIIFLLGKLFKRVKYQKHVIKIIREGKNK